MSGQLKKPVLLDETGIRIAEALERTKASSWDELSEKPFETIGDNLKVVNGALTVDTATEVEQDNTKPVTSAAVFMEIGNIEALLAAL